MAKQKVDPELKKHILKARKIIEYISEKEANEADTRKCIYDIFEMLGYVPLKFITQELAISGTGDEERCDLALRCDEKEPPKVLVEVKRVSSSLASKHLKQIKSYALNKGSEWALLTNGKEWQLYHVSYDQPPELTMIYTWNILNDEISYLADKFNLICFKSLKRGALDQEWITINALNPRTLLKAILSESSIMSIRRALRQISKVLTTRDAIVEAIKRLLNEKALSEIENTGISKVKKIKKNEPTVSE